MGERGPKPTPIALQIVRGDPRQRGRAALAAALDGEVRPPVSIPECPAHLVAEARDEWLRITPHLEALGLVTQIDRAALVRHRAEELAQ